MIKKAAARITGPLQEFIALEASGGIVLLGGTAVALLLANLPTRDAFHDLLAHEIAVGVGDARIVESVEAWINDALMTLFFFVVGLEIKRETVEGELRDRRTAALPVLAAVGGMIVPALLYMVVNLGEPTLRGAGVPVATDIAFCVGVVALLGARVPPTLKVFLLTLAIADDIGGILVIAVFYSTSLSGPWLGAAAAGLLLVWALRRVGVAVIWPFVVVGLGIWVAMYESGVHATIAGVALGLLTPVEPTGGRKILHTLEHRLHPWSSLLVIPLFALANAGIELSSDAIGEAFSSRVTWGVILGLVVGKALGVSAATMLALRAGVGRLPAGLERRHILGVGLLAGIGFTVAIFVANISFPDQPTLLEDAKVGIFVASLLSAALATAWLLGVAPRLARGGDDDRSIAGSAA